MSDSTITVRATQKTPQELRYLDGRTYPIRPGVTPTEADLGYQGVLHGIPGVLLRDGDQLVWQIGTETPPPRVSSIQLGDLYTVLTEIRDLLREASTRWSPHAAAGTDSSTGHGTTPTAP